MWEARFLELHQMALEQCRWFKEEEVGKGERHIFLFDRLPKGLYTSLYQCIQPEIPRADVYLNCSILKKEFPLHFDEGSTLEKSALLNLHVDWGHLVLIIQTAPDFPIKKLTKALETRVRRKDGFFLTIQKDCNHYGSTGRVNSPRCCLILSATIAVLVNLLVGEKSEKLSKFFRGEQKEKFLIS